MLPRFHPISFYSTFCLGAREESLPRTDFANQVGAFRDINLRDMCDGDVGKIGIVSGIKVEHCNILWLISLLHDYRLLTKPFL